MQSEVTGTGDAIVLVPGGLTGWISWEPHAQKLAASNKVVRVQLLAVQLGLENKLLPSKYSVNYEVQALTNTINKLGIDSADFVAWSYGAEVTLTYALNNPDKVRSLTLIEPPAIWVLRSRGPLPPYMEQEQRQISKLASADVSSDQLVWFTHFAGFVPEGVNPRDLPQWPLWYKHRQSLRTGDVVFRHKDRIERVRQFQKPVLLFKGKGSSPFLHMIINILGEEFPKAAVHELPGGHAPQIVAKDKFMQILNAFIR